MLKITTIKNGLVIDHIKAGRGIEIFKKLELEKSNLNVALIMNVDSNTMKKKDIIKMESIKEISYNLLAMISPGVTINEIENGKIKNKIKPQLPEKIIGEICCDNRNCITIDEKYVEQSFILLDKEEGTYKCEYCDHIKKL